MNTFFKTILVLAPHTDDGELGCGGTIARFIEEKATIYYVAFSTADQSLPKNMPKGILAEEVKLATAELHIPVKNLTIYNYEVRKLNNHRQKILDNLVKLKNQLKPDLILLPSLHDIHQDHQTIANEGLRAFKNTTIWGYELLWNNISFDTQCFVKLTDKHITKKINALKHYTSQKQRPYMQKDFIKGQAKMRGVQAGCEYAEAFEVIRQIV